MFSCYFKVKFLNFIIFDALFTLKNTLLSSVQCSVQHKISIKNYKFKNFQERDNLTSFKHINHDRRFELKKK